MNNITTLKPKEGIEILAIVVNKDCEYDVDVAGYTNLYNLTTGKSDIIISNKEENYSILGCVEYNKLIEFDCDELVDYFNLESVYRNYNPKAIDDYWKCNNSKESFISLIEANNINIQQLDKEDKKLIILQKQK